MATEMIKGVKYTRGGKWFTFVRPHAAWKNYGWFRDDAGQMLTIKTDVFDSAKPKEPEPFPEPERWDSIGRVVLTPNRRWAENMFEAASIKEDHNAEIDRLMSEIRRLEAIVHKSPA